MFERANSSEHIPLPADEDERIFRLRRYHILDTQPEKEFDLLTRLAASQFDVPISLVSFVDRDRQWFKSKYGLKQAQTPRDIAFCAYTILDDEIFIVPDATRDDRFARNPLVTGEPHIRFYAGAPLKSDDGYKIGTLCIIDNKPRARLTIKQSELLSALADLVIDELELRLKSRQLHDEIQRLDHVQKENDDLRKQITDATYQIYRAQTAVHREHAIFPYANA
jgi:GAF domain-containing protein